MMSDDRPSNKTQKMKALSVGDFIAERGDWILALSEADRGNKGPLIALLRSDWELPLPVRGFLADLIMRGIAMTTNPPRSRAMGLQDTDPWVAAVDAVASGNKKILVDILQSAVEMPQAARGYIADLVERGIRKPRGRPRTPAYDEYTPNEHTLAVACGFVRHREAGESVDTALTEVAKQFGLTYEMLHKAYRGKGKKLRKF